METKIKIYLFTSPGLSSIMETKTYISTILLVDKKQRYGAF